MVLFCILGKIIRKSLIIIHADAEGIRATKEQSVPDSTRPSLPRCQSAILGINVHHIIKNPLLRAELAELLLRRVDHPHVAVPDVPGPARGKHKDP